MEDDQNNSDWKTTKKMLSPKFENATTTKINSNLIQYNLKTK